MAFESVAEMLALANTQHKPLWEVILDSDCSDTGIDRNTSISKMSHLWDMMKSADKDYRENQHSASGLVGGAGGKMSTAVTNHSSICGDFMGSVVATALKMGECNACMKRIVAAPTAGSCGVLPAVFIPFAKQNNIPDEKIVEALYVTAGFGQVIATRASIAGAEGGCQAEIGSASGMAAAGMVFLNGGTNEMAAHACAMAIKNLLGLVCDPVAGLVEVPCVKRNVVGAVNAIACADMALANIGSFIPIDEVIDAMRCVGDSLPSSLKETGIGGLAGTPTGRSVKLV